MSIQQTTIVSGFKLYEKTVASGAVSSNSQKASVYYDGFDSSHLLTGSTTPAVTTSAFAEVTMTAGAATLDLTAVVCLDGTTKNFNTLKITSIKFRVKAANANRIKIKTGASNGWSPVVGDNFEIPLPANAGGLAWNHLYTVSGSAVVDATHKTLDLVGTGSQILQVAIVGGT